MKRPYFLFSTGMLVKQDNLALFNLNDIYLFIIIDNTITNYILILYELSNFNNVLGVVSQTRVSYGNRTQDPHANGLAHYPLDYQGTQFNG